MTACTVVDAEGALIDVRVTARAGPASLARAGARSLVAGDGVDAAAACTGAAGPVKAFSTF